MSTLLRRLRSEMIFEPERGNVAFGSAIHGWAFRTHDFAALYAPNARVLSGSLLRRDWPDSSCNARYANKLGLKQELLEKTLWGEFYFNPKEKKIMKKPVGTMKPMFVAFVLENIWQVRWPKRSGVSACCARRSGASAGLQRGLEPARRRGA